MDEQTAARGGNKTVQKAVRMNADLWKEISNCMDREGIPDFAGFVHMAMRGLLNRFEDERRIRGADLELILEKWDAMVKMASTRQKLPAAKPKEKNDGS